MAGDTNILGDRGELWAMQSLTQYPKAKRALMRPQFLGAMWASIDLYVEIVGSHKPRPFSFAQVKSTRQGYTVQDKNLKVQLTERSVNALLNVPAPTYFIGVDDRNLTAKVYIWSIRKNGQKAFASMPTRFELTYDNLKILRDEVVHYWKTFGKKPTSSAFEV
jgi:hypothetical protein